MEGVHDLVEALRRLSGVDDSQHYSEVLKEISTEQNISVLEKLLADMKAAAAEKFRRERLAKEMEEQKRCYERDCQSILRRLQGVFPKKVPISELVERIDIINQLPEAGIK